MARVNYEDAPEYSAEAYVVKGYKGMAWHVRGWAIEPAQRIGCTGCDYEAVEREHGGGYTLERHSPECPEDAEPIYDEEAVWERTGQLVCTMIGDDRHFRFDADEVSAIPDESYCHECGQIGCTAVAN